MEKRVNRRQFLKSSLIGAAAIGTGFSGIRYNPVLHAGVDKVRLGSTGLMVPRVAMGTGSIGGRRESNQTRLGTSEFVKLARHAFDRGLKFYDMADTYGSHPFVREVLKEIPREETTLLSKIWTSDMSWLKTEPVENTLDRFRLETGSDYFDIVLLHCLMSGNWQEEKKAFTDSLSKAKQQGIVKSVGVSCHNWDAMVAAVNDPWVDVILARINPFGAHMDGTPEEVMALLETARKNGKGVIGMKIFGNGDNTSVDERERSIKYAITSPNIHCVTLGLESVSQVDDAVERVMKFA
jgi:predicted aldo/keto reductase-like oxidoreductase